MMKQISRVGRAFAAAGIKKDDRVTVCMPNCPQAVLCFYGLNLIGAVATMIHPLSSVGEIAFYIKDSGSVAAVTLEMFYGKFMEVLKEAPVDTLVVSSISDALSPIMKFGYWLTEGRKMDRVDMQPPAVPWSDFLKRATPMPSRTSSSVRVTILRRSCSPAARPARQRVFCSPT